MSELLGKGNLTPASKDSHGKLIKLATAEKIAKWLWVTQELNIGPLILQSVSRRLGANRWSMCTNFPPSLPRVLYPTRVTPIIQRGTATGITVMHKIVMRTPAGPGQAFIAFLGTLHWGWSSFTMHRFALGDYLLQITKERMLLITSKRRRLKIKGKSGWTVYTPYLGGLAQILGSYFKDMQ